MYTKFEMTLVVASATMSYCRRRQLLLPVALRRVPRQSNKRLGPASVANAKYNDQKTTIAFSFVGIAAVAFASAFAVRLGGSPQPPTTNHHHHPPPRSCSPHLSSIQSTSNLTDCLWISSPRQVRAINHLLHAHLSLAYARLVALGHLARERASERKIE